MCKEITGKIIEFISQTEVVINRGKNSGIEEGMIFGIKLELPKIVDPEDSENTLQGIFYEKGEISISAVFEKMSFARIAPRTVMKSTTMPSFSISELVYPGISGKILLNPDDWKIRVGDEVFYKKKSSS